MEKSLYMAGSFHWLWCDHFNPQGYSHAGPLLLLLLWESVSSMVLVFCLFCSCLFVCFQHLPFPYIPMGDFGHWAHLAMFWDTSGCHSLGGWLLLGCLLNIPPCTGQPLPITKNLCPQTSVVPRVRSSATLFLYAHICRHLQNDSYQWQRNDRITDTSSPCSPKSHYQFRNFFSQKDSKEWYIYLE